MRIVGEIPHSVLKITIFEWNNKYLVKLETPFLEQTFKIDQLDITGESALYDIFDESFINEAIRRFNDMSESLSQAMARA